MIGYCQECKSSKKMTRVYTDRLPNGAFVNKGKCVDCGSAIWKSVKDSETVVTKSGKHYPRTIIIGENTPKYLKSLEKINVDQAVVINKDEGLIYLDDTKIKTLKALKEEAGTYEKETFINR